MATTKENTISVRLPLAKGANANQDEFYSVNFKNYIIKRGVRVAIPKELAEVIENAGKAEDYALEYANSKALREA